MVQQNTLLNQEKIFMSQQDTFKSQQETFMSQKLFEYSFQLVMVIGIKCFREIQ